MIPRYTRPEMAAIWEPENRFRIWLDVEIAACEAWNKLGRIPDEALEIIREKADFDVARIDVIEEEVKHDVIAFLTSVAEKVGPESRYIHMGMTSSDVLDTSFGVQLVQAADLILDGLERAKAAVRSKGLLHRDTVMMGRSHGIHAEPTTFGLKMAIWYDELGRAADRVRLARESVAVGKLSGAVGTYSNIPPEIEAHVCTVLGLTPANVGLFEMAVLAVLFAYGISPNEALASAVGLHMTLLFFFTGYGLMCRLIFVWIDKRV